MAVRVDGQPPTRYVTGRGLGGSGAEGVPRLLGLYRSGDEGRHWTRIDDDAHRYGEVRLVVGDPRVYGRVYLGTHGRGIVYGDPR